MPLESVALIPRCAECEAAWLGADDEVGAPTSPMMSRRRSPSTARIAPSGSSGRTDARARDDAEAAMAASAGGRGGQRGLYFAADGRGHLIRRHGSLFLACCWACPLARLPDR